MPELDWQRYLERRVLARVSPLGALLATLGVLLRRAPRLALAALPAYLAGAIWLLFRDRLVRFAGSPGGDFLPPLLLYVVDLLVLWLLVTFATGVARTLLTAEPARLLPRVDRAELRSAAVGLLILALALLLTLLLPVSFADWSPLLFVIGVIGPGAVLGWTLAVALPCCLLLALLAPLLPAAALGPGFHSRQWRRVVGGSWPASLAVALLALGLVLLALVAINGVTRGLEHVGLTRLLLALSLPAVALLATGVLQAGFAVVFARRIGWTSGAAAAR